MIPELGHFALILALSLALCQGIIPLLGAHKNDAAMMGVAGQAYFWGALILTVGYGWAALMAAIWPDTARARRLFIWSLGYLPALLTLMMVDTGS